MIEYIAKAPAAWVEGQVAQLTVGRTAVVFLTLRDPSADVSLSVSCPKSAFAGLARPPVEGDRVVVHGKFEFYPARGSLTFKVDEVHPVGIGEMLARLERLRRLLAAEGLTAPERKRRLPFLPRVVGLITGRNSAAESDVTTNARARWPAVRFRIENVAVQGVTAVPQVIDALARLDRDPAVDVIVLARGGGSVEDLLPFSDEALCRAVSACRTPVVVGHRARARPPDRRRRRRRALLDPDGCGQAGRAGCRRRGCGNRHAAAPSPAGAQPLGDRRAARVARWTNAAVLADPSRSARAARADRGWSASPVGIAGRRVGSRRRP